MNALKDDAAIILHLFESCIKLQMLLLQPRGS